MGEPLVRKRVYVHAGNDEELARRVKTFTTALRACQGLILAVEYRGCFHGRRIAVVSYEFPLRRLPKRTDGISGRSRPGEIPHRQVYGPPHSPPGEQHDGE